MRPCDFSTRQIGRKHQLLTKARAINMSLTQHELLLINDLKYQSKTLPLLYLVAGIVGCIAACLLAWPNLLPCVLAGLSGLSIGLGLEKLVGMKIRQAARKIAHNRPRQHTESTTHG